MKMLERWRLRRRLRRLEQDHKQLRERYFNVEHIDRSTAKATMQELVAAANEIAWLRRRLQEF